MAKHARPKVVPLAVLITAVCVFTSAFAQTPQTTAPISLDEALRLANLQASSFQSALLNERAAAEDVKQARAAFLPK